MLVNILILAVLTFVNYKLLEKLNGSSTVKSNVFIYILFSFGLAVGELLLFSFFKVIFFIALLGGVGYLAYKYLKK